MRIWGFPTWAVAAVLLLTVGTLVFHLEYRDPGPTPPLPAAEAHQAQALLAQTAPPEGFRVLRGNCTNGYVCFDGPSGSAMTARDYIGLAHAFGVVLKAERCDQAMSSPESGRSVQVCDGYGEFQRWGVATTLSVTHDGHGNSQTQINFAPVRRA